MMGLEVFLLVILSLILVANASFVSSLMSMSSLSSSHFSMKQNDSCENGLCSIKPSDPETTQVNNFSSKILSDWKSADSDPLESDQHLATAVDQEETPTPAVDEGTTVPPDELIQLADIAIDERSMKTLIDMGYQQEEASAALSSCNNDVAKAAEYLEMQDEELDARRARLSELVSAGWDQGVAYVALEKCSGNVTAAQDLLQHEEDTTKQNFNIAVQNMVGHFMISY